jgi:hypothetical protein
MPRHALRRRSRTTMIVAAFSVLLGVAMMVPIIWDKVSGDSFTLGARAADLPGPSPSPPPPPTLRNQPVSITGFKGKYLAWALMDRETGEINGSANSATATNSTESMIKVWIVADFLRRKGAKQPTAAELKLTSTAIRNSNDTAAESLYSKVGRAKSLTRLNQICGVSARPAFGGNWAYTLISAQDVTRLGDCLISGAAAGPTWTEYVLAEMRAVRGPVTDNAPGRTTGGGRWGIIDGLPANLSPDAGIKNGWTMLQSDGQWHINCLAVHADWVLAVQMRLPNAKFKSWLAGLQYGAGVCASVTTQLVHPRPEVPSPSPTPTPSHLP